MGFSKSKVEMIPAGNDQSSFGGDSAARNPGGQTRQPQGVQKATDQVQVWEIYAMIDMDNNGKAELYRVVLIGGYPNGGEILSKEPAKFIPYAVGTAFVVPHRLTGISLYDKLASTDNLMTSVKRSWADSMAQATNPRAEAVEGQVNMDDALNARRDGVIRVRSKGAYTPIPTIDVGPSCQMFMNMLAEERDLVTGGGVRHDGIR